MYIQDQGRRNVCVKGDFSTFYSFFSFDLEDFLNVINLGDFPTQVVKYSGAHADRPPLKPAHPPPAFADL